MPSHYNDLNSFWEQNSGDFQPKYPDFFDPEWLVMESNFPWFRLSALDNQSWSQMYQEAKALTPYFHSHRDTVGEGWHSLTVHGLEEDTQTLDSYIPQYGSRQKVLENLHYTWVAEQCPTVKHFLDNVWPAEFLNRVRFMYLEPGGYILPHQDRASDQKRLSVCNISLNNPADCEFVMEGWGTVPFEDSGSAYLMDISNVHSVWNTSNEPRIHMIIHYEMGRRIRDFFYVLRNSYYTNIEQGL